MFTPSSIALPPRCMSRTFASVKSSMTALGHDEPAALLEAKHYSALEWQHDLEWIQEQAIARGWTSAEREALKEEFRRRNQGEWGPAFDGASLV